MSELYGLKNKYTSLVIAYFNNHEEQYLSKASELGRKLVEMNIPPEEIGEIHEEAITRLAEEFPGKTLLDSANYLSAPLMELLMAYGLAFRKWIDQIKLKEQELTKAKQEWEDIFQAISNPTFILSDNFSLIDANRAMVETLNIPRDELIGKKCYKVFHSGLDSPIENCPVKTILSSHNRYTSEMTLETMGRTYLLSCTGVPDKKGNISKVIHIATDITERRQLEEQIRQLQKLEAIGQLAGGVAHDFNNILQIIMACTSFILDGMEPGNEHYKDVMEIHTAAERAANLTRQLLAFSRRQILQPKHINLNEILSDLLKMIRRVIGEDIKLEFVQGINLGTVYADPAMIEQSIMNLCVNARDAMPDGGKITIETRNFTLDSLNQQKFSWAAPGEYACIDVTDTGHGMDQVTLDKIFEPFFTTKEINKGSGLGLSTVYGIVRQHKGFIDVKSKVGQGSTFSLYFPTVEQEPQVMEKRTNDQLKPGKETILVAEDDEMVANVVKRVLEKNGYKVLLAHDGIEAIKIFKENMDEISLILLDVVMPNQGGKETFDEIKKIKPAIPVVFSSGYSMNAIHNKFVLDKGLHLIQKPYDRTSLLRKVREILDQ